MDVGLEGRSVPHDIPGRVVEPQPTVLLSPTSPRQPVQALAPGGPPRRTTSLLMPLPPAFVLLAERPASGPASWGPAGALEPAPTTAAADPQAGALHGGGAGDLKAAIPAMSVPLAVVCLLLNIVLPGSGTVLSGISMCCCAEAVEAARAGRDDTASLACLNVWVGVSQLLTVTFLLVGWLWSITWGVAMVVLAAIAQYLTLMSLMVDVAPTFPVTSLFCGTLMEFLQILISIRG